MPEPNIRITFTQTKAWRDTMLASIDLLVAVEEADDACDVPDEVAVKARALRAVFDRMGE